MSRLRALVAAEQLGSLTAGTVMTLTGPEAVRLARVARARPGEALELFDGVGRAVAGRITAVGRDWLAVLVSGPSSAAEPGLPIILIQAAAKGDRLEMALEKATELGVSAVWVVVSSRSVARPDPDGSRPARWARVVESAARQCGRASVPSVRGPVSWERAMEELASLGAGWLKLVAWEGSSEPVSEVLQACDAAPPAGVAACIGPEGGLTEDEVRSAQQAGARAVSLGRRILRAETAAIALLTLVQAYLGDLRAGRAASPPAATAGPATTAG